MFFVLGLIIYCCSIEIPTIHSLLILCIQVETLTQTDNFDFDDNIKITNKIHKMKSETFLVRK